MFLYRQFLLVFSTLLVVSKALEYKEQCSAIKRTYTELGFSAIDVPNKSRRGQQLKICSKGYSCCTSEMEENLKTLSTQEFGRRLREVTEYTRTTFITATANFNEFFLDLLKSSEQELDAMFSIAYGLQYSQNKDIFDGLFEEFQSYYKGGSINLEDAMNQFFKDIFVRMFALQSPEYDLSDSYLSCVGNQMENLKPFGDIPKTLTRNVRQAFVAARTFVQALAVGRNVALKVAQVEPTESCIEAYTKQSFCSLCKGLNSLRPCHEYCMNVMKGCLANHAELKSSWVKYVAAMNGLAERLEGEGSFNVEVVITPLKDLISESIMEYHGSSKPISDKVFSSKMCGQPPPPGRRNKRRARSKQQQRPKTLAEKKGTLNTLVSDIRARISNIENVWTSLSDSMCEGKVTAPEGSRQCWNGDSSGRYTKKDMDDGLAANSQNPEVWVSPDNPNPIIEEQIKELNTATKHLSNAKLGIDVDWLDFDVSVLKTTEAVVPAKEEDTDPSYSNTEYDISRENSIEMSGSGGIKYIGDDEDLPIGSGWNSETNEFPKTMDSDKQTEGSGGLNFGDNKPIAVAYRPPASKNGNKYNPYPFEYTEISSSGQGYNNYPYDDDDEDRLLPQRPLGNSNKNIKPNVIQAGSTQRGIATKPTASGSASALHTLNVYIFNSLILTACVLPRWVT
ncbi:glypican-6-like isoform X2 [Watersipora subatra]|uniref:glypican-6-like isoform X2 n=1 Tax=Watersipora subatra TaxID=2589382 RepID=UPI00355C89BB